MVNYSFMKIHFQITAPLKDCRMFKFKATDMGVYPAWVATLRIAEQLKSTLIQSLEATLNLSNKYVP